MALTQISTAGVKDDAVTAGKIPANAVGSSELADNAVDTAAIANGAVTTAKIAAGNITATELGSNSVTGAKIAAGAINNANKIQDSIITGAKIGSGTITDGNLATNSVTTGKIANDAVTVDKVADDAIGVAQLSASGTASSSTFLRGDNSWTAVNTDLVSDTSPQLGGSLDVNSKNVNFGDSTGTGVNRIRLGASNDLQIYHQSSNNTSYLYNTSTDLTVMTTNNVNIKSDTGEFCAKFVKDSVVELYHDNVKTFETKTGGVQVGISSGTGSLRVKGYSSPDGGARYADLIMDSNCTLRTVYSDGLIFNTNQTNRAYFDGSTGHFTPWSNNTYDCGTANNRWRNVYANDLQLSNEAKKDDGGNDVDGTWGDWTLQEGETSVFMINNRSGKKFKIKMEEV